MLSFCRAIQEKEPKSEIPASPFKDRNTKMADAENHVDVDGLLEDYAWRMFKDLLGVKKAGLDNFKHLEKDEAEFVIVSS